MNYHIQKLTSRVSELEKHRDELANSITIMNDDMIEPIHDYLEKLEKKVETIEKILHLQGKAGLLKKKRKSKQRKSSKRRKSSRKR